MAVTIREVAKEAGVSVAAVSKVLHGGGNSVRVSEERAKEIREVARRLAYYPNALARNLRSSRTHSIGLVFENFGQIASGPLYYMHLLDGVASTIFPKHYRLTILPELDRNNIYGSLADGQIDGVLWCKLARDEQTRRIIDDCPIPIVALSAPAPEVETKTAFVNCDNRGGMKAAIDHLWGLGHRKILFACEEEEITAPDCIARRDAFQSVLAERGANPSEEDFAVWDWRMQGFKTWWGSKPTHTAIICWSERAAGDLLKRADEAQISIPNDLSVIGFDSTPYCETTKPRLTAVNQPISEMAQFAARVLLDMIEGRTPPQLSTTFPCDLDVRDSTARPRPQG